VTSIVAFMFSSKCNEISRRLSLRLSSALNVGKLGKQSKVFTHVLIQH